MIWSALISPLASLAGTWMEGKVEKTKAVAQAHVAEAKSRATIAEKKATGDIDWEQAAIENTATSWKDEWLTLLFSVPLILAFCGDWGREIVAEGFAALEAMPTFYQYTLGTIVAASFGVRSATKFFGKK